MEILCAIGMLNDIWGQQRSKYEILKYNDISRREVLIDFNAKHQLHCYIHVTLQYLYNMGNFDRNFTTFCNNGEVAKMQLV